PPQSPICSLSLHDALPISRFQISNLVDLLRKVRPFSCPPPEGHPHNLIIPLGPAPPAGWATRSPRPNRSTSVRRNADGPVRTPRSEEHTSELQSRFDLVCR